MSSQASKLQATSSKRRERPQPIILIRKTGTSRNNYFSSSNNNSLLDRVVSNQWALSRICRCREPQHSFRHRAWIDHNRPAPTVATSRIKWCQLATLPSNSSSKEWWTAKRCLSRLQEPSISNKTTWHQDKTVLLASKWQNSSLLEVREISHLRTQQVTFSKTVLVWSLHHVSKVSKTNSSTICHSLGKASHMHRHHLPSSQHTCISSSTHQCSLRINSPWCNHTSTTLFSNNSNRHSRPSNASLFNNNHSIRKGRRAQICRLMPQTEATVATTSTSEDPIIV